jgi:transcriptional regulator with XRE-family HTH domain
MKNHERLKLARDHSREVNAEIGERIAVARRKALVPRDKLAEALGYRSVASIYQIEDGTKTISAADLAAIAECFNCTVRSLYPKGSVR